MKKLVFISILLMGFLAFGQDNAQKSSKDPKVGLVLSGGGAKGLAHIGALKVIDSLGIEIDYIAGTSMGAIVGSLYASGYTGKQLDSIFEETNFDDLISDDIPRGARTLKERMRSERYAVTLPFKDFKVELPSSLSKGQNVYNFLSRLLVHVRDEQDFSKLPIPFFCIATDIENGQEVVLDSGYLPRAVNASGALPSIFAPVEIDGRLLTDGGVTDNYPVEKLREKGMDFIIGVDVQDDYKSRDEISGALDILTQINNFRTIQDMEKKRPKTDIYIHPDIKKFTVVSFGEGREIINSGEKATIDRAEDLKTLSTGYEKEPLKGTRREGIYINSVSVSGNSSYSDNYITSRLKLKAPGYIYFEDLRNGINNLQATQNFTKINYSINLTSRGNQLQINVIETDVKNSLNLSLHYDELFKSAALVNLTRKNILFKQDMGSIDFIVGDNLRYNFNYDINLDSYWSIGFNSDSRRFTKDVSTELIEGLTPAEFPNVNNIDLRYREYNQRLFFRTKIDRRFNFTSGLELKSFNLFTETLATNDPEEQRTIFDRSSTTSLYGDVEYDSYDHPLYASSGWFIKGGFNFYFLNTEFKEDFNRFSIAELQVGRAFGYGKFSLRTEGHVGVTIGYPERPSLNFFLGGYGNQRFSNYVPFYGYDFIEISGDTMIKFLGEIDYELFPKNHLSFHVNLASVQDELFEQDDWFTNARYMGYALGYGIETFLGPIELKYSFSPQRDDAEVFVVIGFRF